jgi:hypothetical protein
MQMTHVSSDTLAFCSECLCMQDSLGTRSSTRFADHFIRLPRSPKYNFLVLLSQKVAALADENHVFGKIQFSACRGLRWVCQNLVMPHHGFRRTSRV